MATMATNPKEGVPVDQVQDNKDQEVEEVKDEGKEEQEDVFAQQNDEEGEFNIEDILGTNEGDSFGIKVDEEGKTGENEGEKPKANPKKETTEEKSFKYWQSQADKKQNRIEELEKMLDVVDRNTNVPNRPSRPSGKRTNGDAGSEDKKPKAPKKPKKPAYFSRDDAMTDPSSSSAKYLNDLEEWRDDMTVYNQELIEYTANQSTTKIEKMEADKRREKAEMAARMQQRRQLQSLQKKLVDDLGASEEQSIQFIKEMSQPNSISLDNLWQLFALKHNVQVGSEQKQRRIPGKQPSDEFKQAKKTQGVPTPMGTIPGQSDKQTKSPEDLIMDKMKAMEKEENPF